MLIYVVLYLYFDTTQIQQTNMNCHPQSFVKKHNVSLCLIFIWFNGFKMYYLKNNEFKIYLMDL